MIIVSQDKETIINFENITRISIMPPVEEGYKYSIAINSCLDLGYYKTEERAKEVFQDIISRYEAIQLTKMSNKDYGYTLQDYIPVYEMPKE